MRFVHRAKTLYRTLTFRRKLCIKAGFSAAEAEVQLRAFLPRSKPEYFQKNRLAPEYDVMIVVPVYNVEPYLEQCIRSILGQKTRYRFQAVFVNDGSTDRSGELLRSLVPAPHVILEQENQGVSAARNAALRTITGRYVMFVDSDDYLSENAVELMVRTADAWQADILEVGHQEFDENGILACNRHADSVCMLHPRDLYGYPWGKVIAASLLDGFCFPVGYLFEDTVMSTLLHPAGRKIVSIPDLVYHYRRNPGGYTQTSRGCPEAVDTYWITRYCLEERLRRGQVLEEADHLRYLTAVHRNWMRTRSLPDQIQEQIFVLTSDLFRRCLPLRYTGSERRYRMLETAIRRESWQACLFVLERWDLL